MSADFDAGAKLAELHDDRGKNTDNVRFARADTQGSRDLIWLLSDVFGLFDGIKYFKGVRQEPFPGLRQFYLLSDSLK